MELSRIEASGIYSFGTGAKRFELDLSGRVTAVVGPNGSGKSSLGRVLDLVQSAVGYNDVDNQSSQQSLRTKLQTTATKARHRGMLASERSEVRLQIALTSQYERGLLVAYLRAAVYSAVVGNHGNSIELEPLERWVEAEVIEEKITDLFSGTIVISHSGVPNTDWEVAYEFTSGDELYAWYLDTTNPNAENAITREGPPPDISEIHGLSLRVAGTEAPSTPLVVPGDEQHFSIATILPNTDGVVRVQVDPANANRVPAPLRAFVDLAGVVEPINDPSQLYQRRYNAAAVFRRILERGLVISGVQGSHRDPETESAGFGTFQAALLGQRLSRRDGRLLPARLHQLKMGDFEARRRFEEVRQLFKELAPGRDFEIVTTTLPQGNEQPLLEIQIEVFPIGPQSEDLGIAIELAGTGVEQALSIAEAIEGSTDRLLLLDEPAVNLHPGWQRLVRARLRRGPGQFLLLTHSPFLISTESNEDLAAINRLRMTNGATEVCHITPRELAGARWAGALVKELSASAEARSLLFASGVVLLEGETELAALPAWFSASDTGRLHRSPDDLHVAFFAVNGDQSFAHMIGYLESFGIPWAIVCDGAAFRFDIHSHIFKQVLAAGDEEQLRARAEELETADKKQSDLHQALFDQMVAAGKTGGIFTLASGWTTRKDGDDRESFEAFLRTKPDLAAALDAAAQEAPKSKVRQGRIVADTIATCPVEVDDLYRQILERLWSKGMPKLPAP